MTDFPIRKDPCHECAFLRTCPPGLLGGSPVETYIGQALGPFFVPCHLQTDFRDPQWKEKAWNVAQCAGIAIFRANLGVDSCLPPGMGRLPASTAVFQTFEEFVAHHKQIPLMQAWQELQVRTPFQHLQDQLKRHDNQARPA